jgi:hypothetical protein
MNQQEIIQQAINFISRERPCLFYKYNLNESTQPYFLREIIFDCRIAIDNKTIITMLDNNKADKLRAAAKVNIEVQDICNGLTELITTQCILAEILRQMEEKSITKNGQAGTN